jgi:hypothetical protein
MVVTAVIPIASYFFTNSTLKSWNDIITTWGSIISAFAIGLGSLVTIRFHLGNAQKRGRDWIWSAWMIVITLLTYGIGLALTTNSPIYSWIFVNVLSSLSATTYSLVGLFVVTAGYRAFRARNLEAGILLVVALIVMIGNNIPIGAMITPYFPQLATWILNFPNTGASRGTLFAAIAVGTGYLIRVLIGRERGA